MTMDSPTFYFAYGSNMAAQRLAARVSSARLVCVAVLRGHALKFHKPGSADGSGKCDAAYTGHSEDRVLGALYSMDARELPTLDRFEGCGNGYERKAVLVSSLAGEAFEAQTYLATRTDHRLRPLDWYKEHVMRGAKALGLPHAYIASIEAVGADADPDEQRSVRELAIYGELVPKPRG